MGSDVTARICERLATRVQSSGDAGCLYVSVLHPTLCRCASESCSGWQGIYTYTYIIPGKQIPREKDDAPSKKKLKILRKICDFQREAFVSLLLGLLINTIKCKGQSSPSSLQFFRPTGYSLSPGPYTFNLHVYDLLARQMLHLEFN